MSESKIQIKVGIVEFAGEGNQDWLAEQLDKIIKKIPELLKIELASPAHKPAIKKDVNGTLTGSESGEKPKNLALFLKEKSATSNQTKKFLATAAFLQINGKSRMTTTDVATALKNSNQGKLGNPSDALLKNIAKGHCEKDGSKDFFVTTVGLDDLGITEE